MELIPFQNTGYDIAGNPIDFMDEDGYIWIYQGPGEKLDRWMGIPPED